MRMNVSRQCMQALQLSLLAAGAVAAGWEPTLGPECLSLPTCWAGLGRDSFRRWTLGSTAENPVEARARRRLKVERNPGSSQTMDDGAKVRHSNFGLLQQEYHRGPVQPGRRLHHVLPADVRARLSSSARPLNRLDKKAQEIVMKIAEMQESPDLCAELESRIKLQQAERQKREFPAFYGSDPSLAAFDPTPLSSCTPATDAADIWWAQLPAIAEAGNRAAIRRNKELAKISSPSHRQEAI